MSAESQQLEPAGDQGQIPAVRDEATAMLEMIERVALDERADVDKMRALLDMRREVMADAARMAFNRDFIALQNELPEITEGGQIIHNDRLISKYARWDEDINPAIKPILARHNFVLSFETNTDEGVKVTAHLIHQDGHSRQSSYTLPPETSGAKNNVQALGSSTSYGKRYAASALLNLTTRGLDDDGNATGIDRITESQVADLQSLMEEVKADPAGFARYLKKRFRVLGGKLENIAAQAYPDVVAALERKRQS